MKTQCTVFKVQAAKWTYQSVLMWNRLWYSKRVTKMVGSVMTSSHVRPPRPVGTNDRYL